MAGVPAYNEEKTIAKVILLAEPYVDVVVVCDDGSNDMTADIAKKLGAVVISHGENLGYGLALRSLFEKAKALKADILITLDADLQHNPKEIPRLLQPLIDDKADIIVGSRFLEGDKGIPTYRRFGIRLLTKLTKTSGKNNLSDAQSGFRAYGKRALENIELHEKGMGVSAEILWKASSAELRISEVPIHISYKDARPSTYHPIDQGMSVISTIIRLTLEEHPLVFLGWPGLALLAIGLLFGVYTFQLYTIEGRIVTNLALATFAFGLAGIFAIFTAITLYAIGRLAQKTRP